MVRSASRQDIDQSFERIIAANDPGALADSFAANRPSIKERLAAGKAMRAKVPRNSHAAFPKDPGRPDPIDILEAQNRTRVQKLVPVRYTRMLASPFAFLRGSAAVMVADLSTSPASGMFV